MVLEFKNCSILSVITRKKRSPPRPSLLDMPDIPLNMILKECDFCEINAIQKTCHDLRSYINTIKFDPKVSFIQITGPRDAVLLTLMFTGSNKSIHVEYRHHKDGCIVFWKGNKSKFIRNSNFLEFFMEDFLRLMGGEVDRFEYNTANELHEIFKKNMMSRASIRVKNLRILNIGYEEMMNVLPYFCPMTLDGIQISCLNGSEIDGIVQTDQWKNCKNIDCYPAFHLAPIQSFVHFPNGNFWFRRVTLYHLRILMKTFLTTTDSTKTFKLMFNSCSDYTLIYQFLGAPLYNNPGSQKLKTWQWLYQKSEIQVISIILKHESSFQKSFNFKIISMEELTEFEIRKVKEQGPEMVEEEIEEEEVEVEEVREVEVVEVKPVKERVPQKLQFDDNVVVISDEVVENFSCYDTVSKFFSKFF